MNDERSQFGFWLYILSDCILFAALFAVFAVLRGEVAGGPSGKDLLDLPFVLVETIILLTSSYTMGAAVLFNRGGAKRKFYAALAATLILGLAFLGLELSEFHSLALEGFTPARSAFLSSFFALVGTHGLHVFAGCVWMLYVAGRPAPSRLKMLALFWHFLDIVWIFIFTVVYLFSLSL